MFTHMFIRMSIHMSIRQSSGSRERVLVVTAAAVGRSATPLPEWLQAHRPLAEPLLHTVQCMCGPCIFHACCMLELCCMSAVCCTVVCMATMATCLIDAACSTLHVCRMPCVPQVFAQVTSLIAALHGSGLCLGSFSADEWLVFANNGGIDVRLLRVALRHRYRCLDYYGGWPYYSFIHR